MGARAVQTAVLDAHPQAALSVFVVWVPTLTGDSFESAQETTALIRDERVVHFYDSARRVGGMIAASVGGGGVGAYDSYLFYRAGVAWAKVPPPPDCWMHQLGPSVWADPLRFRWAESLGADLRAAADDLLQGN